MDDTEIKKLINDKIKFGNISELSSVELLVYLMDSRKIEELTTIFNSSLSHYSGDLTALLSLNYNQLIKERGFSPKLASKISAISELSKRTKFTDNKGIEIIQNSSDIAQLFCDEFRFKETEELWVVYLNNGNRVLDKRKISDGSTNMVLADIKLIIRHAIKLLATKIILVHNHPSAQLTASDSDILLTQKVEKAANYFDIKLLDHIILSPDGNYYSFNDNL